MTDIRARLAAAPTHIIYFTRGCVTLITQTVGEVIREDDDTLTIHSAAGDRDITVAQSDVLARKDNGERVTPDEVHQIFADHGHEQRI